MYQYYHIKVVNNPDIFIIRVKRYKHPRKEARRIIMKFLDIAEEKDFEIRLIAFGSMVSQANFVEGIAQFTPVTHS